MIGREKIWKIRISQGNRFYGFYVVSIEKPMIIFESYFGKLRRIFDISYKKIQSQPVFYVPRWEKATVKLTDEIHGFKVKEISTKHIVLEAQNPDKKYLYEITLIDKKVKGFIKKNYILARDKKDAKDLAEKFKRTYWIKVKRATKMDCYPILSVNKDRIILGKI